jgi:preprotein translocase subunit SecF
VRTSVRKIVVLVVLMAIFFIGALTSRWAEKSGYDHINHRSEQAQQSAPDTSSHRNQVDSQSAESQAAWTEPETENRFVTAWTSRSEDSHDLAELQARAGGRKLNRVGRNSVESVGPQESEGPDDRKDTYGDADVE